MVVKFTLNDIADVAKQLISLAGSARVIAFHGEMGAGKTTLIDAICHVMEVTDTPGSPTFSIINEYKTAAGQTIYHMDLYRLSGNRKRHRQVWKTASILETCALLNGPKKSRAFCRMTHFIVTSVQLVIMNESLK